MSLFKTKPWKLSSDDDVDVTLFENWSTWVTYCLSNDTASAPFVEAAWQSTADNNNRGLVADPGGLTVAQKKANLEMALGFIAINAPILSRSTIVHESTSLQWIFNEIREYYGFQINGSRWLDLEMMRLKPDERPQALYQRLSSFVDENLRKRGGPLTHKGRACAADEVRTETVDNWVMSRWLSLVNPKLPQLIKTQYSVQLKTQTLASLKSDIFSSLDALLTMCESDGSTCRTFVQPSNTARPSHGRGRQPFRPSTGARPSSAPSRAPKCSICTKAGLPNGHYLRQCKFLLPADNSYLKSRHLEIDEESFVDDQYSEDAYAEDPPDISNVAMSSVNTCPPATPTIINRVETSIAALWKASANGTDANILMDTGSGGEMIDASICKNIGAKIRPATQGATQADGETPLDVIGETSFTIERDGMILPWKGLVCKKLSTGIIVGLPFMKRHDISIRPSQSLITFHKHNKKYVYNPAETSA